MNSCDNKKCTGVTNDCADCLQIIVDAHQRRIAMLRRKGERERAAESDGESAQLLNAIRQIRDAIGRLTEAVNRK